MLLYNRENTQNDKAKNSKCYRRATRTLKGG